jgi:hypothetical protein
MTKQTNKPALTIRDGSISATIWRNESEKGSFYSVTFGRTFKDAKGDFRTSDSFSGTQLLRLARLADRAYEQSAALREQDKMSFSGEEE